MDTLAIKYTDQLSQAATDKMNSGHEKYEREHGVAINYNRFALILSDEVGEVFGALNGYTAYAEIYIEDLWVDEALRRLGYGKKLVEALENHFKGSGYNNINLVTNEFQAPDFYKKCGYEIEFIRVNKDNHKLTKTFFIKYL